MTPAAKSTTQDGILCFIFSAALVQQVLMEGALYWQSQ